MAITQQTLSSAEQLLSQANTFVQSLEPGSTEQAAALTARDAINGLYTVLWTLRDKT